MNLIHYAEKGTGKIIVVNLDLVCKFKEGNEMNPLLYVSYPSAPDAFMALPYLWKDFLKNFYPAEEE